MIDWIRMVFANKKHKIFKNRLLIKQKMCYTAGVKSNVESGKGDYKMYTVFDIANWFLSKQEMSHKKLQKMCYYAQAWSYALHNKPIMEEDFQAWVHGPVSPRLYQKYKGNGFHDLKYNSSEGIPEFSSEETELLESVFLTYGDYTGNALEALTHKETPWVEAREGVAPDENCRNIISTDTMRRFYQSIYSGGDA